MKRQQFYYLVEIDGETLINVVFATLEEVKEYLEAADKDENTEINLLVDEIIVLKVKLCAESYVTIERKIVIDSPSAL